MLYKSRIFSCIKCRKFEEECQVLTYIPEEAFKDYIKVDDNFECCRELTNEDMVNEVQDKDSFENNGIIEYQRNTPLRYPLSITSINNLTAKKN